MLICLDVKGVSHNIEELFNICLVLIRYNNWQTVCCGGGGGEGETELSQCLVMMP